MTTRTHVVYEQDGFRLLACYYRVYNTGQFDLAFTDKFQLIVDHPCPSANIYGHATRCHYCREDVPQEILTRRAFIQRLQSK